MLETRDVPANTSQPRLWAKLASSAWSAGRRVVQKALCLYYSSTDPQTPAWAKTVIAAALAYFIFPFDVIPDVIPFAGYVDDWGALVAALAFVATHITSEHHERARDALARWFGE